MYIAISWEGERESVCLNLNVCTLKRFWLWLKIQVRLFFLSFSFFSLTLSPRSLKQSNLNLKRRGCYILHITRLQQCTTTTFGVYKRESFTKNTHSTKTYNNFRSIRKHPVAATHSKHTPLSHTHTHRMERAERTNKHQHSITNFIRCTHLSRVKQKTAKQNIYEHVFIYSSSVCVWFCECCVFRL